MQTTTDDPRVKLMQKWSQNMPAYGMQGASLRSRPGEDDDDEDEDERRTSDTRSVMSMQSGRSGLSNLFYISGHNEDLKLARAKLGPGGGGGAPTKKNKKGKGKKGKQNTGENTNQNSGQHNHNTGNNKKKYPKNKAYLTDFKTITKEEVGKRRTAIADKIHEFQAAVDADLQLLRGDLSSYNSLVTQIKQFNTTQSPRLYENIIEALDRMQKELMMKERTDKKLKNDLHRIRPYIVLPVEMDEETFQKRVKIEGTNEKMLLNLHVYFLKICLAYTKHKTMPAKVMEKMTTDKETIPSYKTKQEEDENFKIVYRAWRDAQALKNVYETYTAYIQKTDKSPGKGADFHYIKF